jgi:methylenetetrahydrofolate dehydrogenase (NADP+)/methenyltetrahydrofolate cyclohydrolase
MMRLLDGKELAQDIKSELATEVAQMRAQGQRPPHLAAVLVGDDPASQVYVRNKVKSCEAIGFESTLIRLNTDTTEAALLKIVADLNQNPDIDLSLIHI